MHDERETAVAGKRGSHASLDDDLGMLLPELGEQVSREKEKHANFGGEGKKACRLWAVRWARARKEKAGPRLGIGPELLAGAWLGSWPWACPYGLQNRPQYG